MITGNPSSRRRPGPGCQLARLVKDGSRLSPGRRCYAVLSIVLMLAGCMQRDANADHDRQGGFYGGVSGGLTR